MARENLASWWKGSFGQLSCTIRQTFEDQYLMEEKYFCRVLIRKSVMAAPPIYLGKKTSCLVIL
jgi:hypothetical protein